MSLHITGGEVLTDALVRADVVTEGEAIAALDGAAPARALQIDATGLYVLPGIVDCHGDAFERHIMPRPSVSFDIDLALRDADRAILASGITTAFHGVTWSWEPGLRGADNARQLVERIAALKPELGADTRFHLRHETFNLAAEAEIVDWLGTGRVGVLAFNDHTGGILKSSSRPGKVAKMVERTGLTHEDFMALAENVWARKDEVPGSIERLAAAARAAGVPVMSHDDMTPEMRRWYRGLGVTVAEFPINEATTREAAAHGEAVVFGAPNVVRGGSHLDCPAAEAMVRAGLCTILASDYYYPALPLAPFILVRKGAADFATAWRLVSQGPAEALGLTDRGLIAPGKRADLVLVAPEPQPRVVATISGGRLVHLADQRILA
ncbi:MULTISPECIES: alpha-D-ribose 1-methylphosphonate 5-triphosphate diphosphatase [unclassified Bosea (in: a-proteobacteria)]|uniref:alpha-D-ribose 1-methylphosphonate 5-triphosphate diphosphatase n=1 Tax=unclassified Bosea (in: a-proteobacteria) TaxID=2653178 RepID=UPI000F753BA5|nr:MULTISPECIES: alpha-D-ribose 1-methylphosphonate 5-triphosphate diphosphatase [unclassified Bosea (in: a-proteobacteria)]AZO78305.1 alpha-D-ribose 1-methylphosphonate 5-triphosphate diphosphatase [Bosea sp. Tri-49]RXT20208.1 alpha-D-ribose 1-methylphosphonate 5-triphosphate diphosphatase [Bosea sp. Tri-39]RXT37080.1 alpha-D-ribose 1-methylphosphonate 5-triphosphate diphosphatase [Bosea sp. Tri-54]